MVVPPNVHALYRMYVSFTLEGARFVSLIAMWTVVKVHYWFFRFILNCFKRTLYLHLQVTSYFCISQHN